LIHDLRQIQLFKEDARESFVPEEELYLSASGGSYADWEGTV
jgi:hypothetical protein